MDFNDLLARRLPESTVEIGDFALSLRALSSKDLDDMITRYPPEKGKETAFGPDLRFELIARTVTDPQMTTEQVQSLLEHWSRPDVFKLQSAVFELNWEGNGDDQVPLSETGSDGTGDTP